MLKKLVWFVLLCVCSGLAAANNTGGVFGPVVNEDHRSWQYRAAITDEDAFAQRLHYQSALNGDFMWRTVAQLRKANGDTADFDYLQAELFWQLADVRDGWQQGLRFDARLRDDNRPNQVGLNWMHQFRLSDNWSARALLLTTYQFGDNIRSGIGLQARGSLTNQLSDRTSLSLSWFSDYGTSSDTLSSSEQFHQLGPTATFTLPGKWQILTGALFGLTNSTPDQTFRFWVTRRL